MDMSIWVWIAIIVVAAVGFWLWKQVQEGTSMAAEIVESGSLMEDADADTAYSFGVGATNQGNTTEAIKWFRKAESLGHEEAAQELGRLLEETGQIEEAKLVYRRNVDRTYAPAAINLALINEKEGDFEGALRHIREAMDGGVNDGNGSLAKWIEELEQKAAAKSDSGSQEP